MYTVSIESDARYAWDEGRRRFVEVCPECERERTGAGPTCRCGHSFDRLRRGFFVRQWEPARLAVRFPERCPHCLGAPERTRRLWNAQYTGLAAGGARTTHLALDVPVCRRVRPPLLLAFAELVAVFGLVVVLLAVVFESLTLTVATAAGAGAALLALGAAVWWLHRARTWLRFVRFDHRSLRLKARRRSYAEELAKANGGRVL